VGNSIKSSVKFSTKIVNSIKSRITKLNPHIAPIYYEQHNYFDKDLMNNININSLIDIVPVNDY
jgi:hypothetical protein